MDQDQPHKNIKTSCRGYQVVNYVKTKPRLVGNQICFSGDLSEHFHWVGLGPLSKILTFKCVQV